MKKNHFIYLGLILFFNANLLVASLSSKHTVPSDAGSAEASSAAPDVSGEEQFLSRENAKEREFRKGGLGTYYKSLAQRYLEVSVPATLQKYLGESLMTGNGLEIGAGDGFLLKLFNDEFRASLQDRYTLSELDPFSHRELVKTFPNFKTVQADATTAVNDYPEGLDFVLEMDVLSILSFKEMKAFFKALHAKLVPGGKMVSFLVNEPENRLVKNILETKSYTKQYKFFPKVKTSEEGGALTKGFFAFEKAKGTFILPPKRSGISKSGLGIKNLVTNKCEGIDLGSKKIRDIIFNQDPEKIATIMAGPAHHSLLKGLTKLAEEMEKTCISLKIPFKNFDFLNIYQTLVTSFAKQAGLKVTREVVRGQVSVGEDDIPRFIKYGNISSVFERIQGAEYTVLVFEKASEEAEVESGEAAQ